MSHRGSRRNVTARRSSEMGAYRLSATAATTWCNAFSVDDSGLCACLVVSRLRCNTLKCTAMHCNALQCTATRCNTLQHAAAHYNMLQHTATYSNTLQHTATHCNTLQHTATHCNTLLVQRPRVSRHVHIYTRRHTATRWNTVQHTATLVHSRPQGVFASKLTARRYRPAHKHCRLF